MLHDFSRALAEAEAGAQDGDPSAAYRLAQLNALGLGCAQSYTRAVRWYRSAAEKGHAGAQCNLGFMFGTGRGVPQDYVQAYAWYNIAAAAGEEAARRNRDAVAALMGAGQLERAQDLSRELFERLEGAGDSVQ